MEILISDSMHRVHLRGQSKGDLAVPSPALNHYSELTLLLHGLGVARTSPAPAGREAPGRARHLKRLVLP